MLKVLITNYATGIHVIDEYKGTIYSSKTNHTYHRIKTYINEKYQVIYWDTQFTYLKLTTI